MCKKYIEIIAFCLEDFNCEKIMFGVMFWSFILLC